MMSVMRGRRPAAMVASGCRRRAHVLAVGLILAVGLTACVEVPPGPGYEPGVSVGVGFYQPTYPNMVLVPGYPVYYAPYVNANYFFYDGMYWLYQGDRWYSSGWYNGPWNMSGPHYVPYYVLQVPVRYYRAPPPYFHGWRADESPHWGEHWGQDWQQRHPGWNERNRWVPPPAPLPKYQASYAGNQYPRDRDQQEAIRVQNYHYQPRDNVTPSPYQPPAQPSHPQQQQHQAPAAPGWQSPQYQSPGRQPQQEQRPPQYQPPQPQEPQNEEHSNPSQVHRPPASTPSQSQPASDHRQPTPSTAPQAQPNQQHSESPPPAWGHPSQPAPQHPQATPPPDQSSSPPAQGQANKKSPPPDKTDDGQGDRR
jgi:hypothetical protein